MALYRKYRPATFAEVVGQEHVTDPLSTALDTGRISHAYLFSGPRGCGKTSSARILARSLNCVEGPTSRPCGVCASCVALGPGGAGNLDVIELDAASHGGVDDTRELRDRAFYAPAESRYRVFIVDEAHMVTTAGFNALLKIVEEPPAHLIFIFATTEPDKVLPTIRSRTHHYPFRLLPPATMRGLLGKICEQEHVPVEEAVYPLVIRAGGGSPRDSLSVLDQLLAGAGPEGVTYPRAVSLLGVTDVALIDDAIDALAADDGAALFGTVDSVMEAGHDPRRFAVDLLERLRDLILLRAVPDAAERGLVSGPGDAIERMRDQAERLGPATLTRYAELLHEGLGEMRGATAPRLLLEVICARMLLPSVSDAESATLQRLERLERGFAGGAVPAPPARPGPAAGEAPGERPSAPAPRPAGGENRRRGAELLAAARAEKEAAAGGSAAQPSAVRPDAAGSATQQSAHQPPTAAGAGQAPTAAGANPAAGVASANQSPVSTATSQPPVGGAPTSQPSTTQPADAADAERRTVDPSRSDEPSAQSSAAAPQSESTGAQPSSASSESMTQAGSGLSASSDASATRGAEADRPTAEPRDREAEDAAHQDGSPSRATSPRQEPALEPPLSVTAQPASEQPGTPQQPSSPQGTDSRESSSVQGEDLRQSPSPQGADLRQSSPAQQGGAPEQAASAAGLASGQQDGALQQSAASRSQSVAQQPSGAPEASELESRRAAAVQESGAQQGESPQASDPQRAFAPEQAAAAGQRPADAPGQPQFRRPSEAAREAAPIEEQAVVEPQVPAATQDAGTPGEDLVALVDGAWAEIKGKVREFGPTLQALLSGAAVSRAEGNVVVFAHQSPPLAQRLSDPRNIEAVRSAVRAVLGRELDVRWETGAPAPRPTQAAKPAGGAARGGAPGEAKPAGRPKFSRPSQANGNPGRPAGQARSGSDDDIPPPDFPDLPDDPGPDEGYGPDSGRSGGDSARAEVVLGPPTPEEEQEMLAAAAVPVAPGDRQDPDEVALALLREELGAKSLDG
ncbi:DNA polymerase III subunit gamma and tau [Nocardia asteroides]|uniref:DNA polymerase III subunit gamma and tau n=1 Tax=Nocardia asteroides TaxID=1824 RepID=UPI0037CCC053